MSAGKPEIPRLAGSSGPELAARLGYAGLLPFLFGALYLSLAALGRNPLPYLEPVTRGLVVYGAVILSFLGGVRWGVAMARRHRDRREFALSVLPSLAGWGAVFLAPPLALSVLAAGFMLQGGGDQSAAARGLLPSWYGTLRGRLSAVVVTSLLVAAAGLLLGSVR